MSTVYTTVVGFIKSDLKRVTIAQPDWQSAQHIQPSQKHKNGRKFLRSSQPQSTSRSHLVVKQQDFLRAAGGEYWALPRSKTWNFRPTFLINTAPQKNVKIIFKVGGEQLGDPPSTLAAITPQPTEPAKVKMIIVTIVMFRLTIRTFWR